MNTQPLQIEALIFDVGEVQVQGLYGSERHLGPCVGKPVDGKKLFTSPHLSTFFRGECSEDDLWRSWKTDFSWNASVRDLKEAVRNNFTEIPGTRAIIEALRARRFRLGLLSVHGREWVRYIESKFHYHKPFHDVSYSYNEGHVPKPHPRAFLDSAKRLGFPPEQCLVVDDYHVNTDAAAAEGFNTYLFTGAAGLKTFLIEHGLLV